MSRADTVQLLLDAPGQTPIDLPHSPWRAWVLTDRGPVLPPVAAGSIRLSPVAGRGERALVAAVAADDPVALGQALDVAGPAQDAARVLFALRHADIAPAEAASVLGRVLGSGASNDKLLRRHWSDLHLHVQLAPGVPALVSLGRMGLGLLLVEVLVQSGRPADALGVRVQVYARNGRIDRLSGSDDKVDPVEVSDKAIAFAGAGIRQIAARDSRPPLATADGGGRAG